MEPRNGRGKMFCGVAFSVLAWFNLFTSLVPVECRPYNHWFDYDYFPQAKPVQDTETGQILGIVNPLRPYEPWILDCNLLFHEKVENGKRHPRCKEVDETNEKEYAKFLLHVQQWEEAYPDRAERWNTRFPEAKESEKNKYEQLKTFSDSHKQIVEIDEELGASASTTTSSKQIECSNKANCRGTLVEGREQHEQE